MALRSGASYLEALKDGREVWLGGERVSDVTAHPQLAGCAASLAENFDLQRDPKYADLLSFRRELRTRLAGSGTCPGPLRT
jgi:4-hydroxyphenylacetate 3-monooxygenase